ncbi:DedA family protein [Arthrobacter celericrescens]|uniref:DedA family protein n=1 Tax=Arthrobacter celericrescens TaxID=2320851 RepID=UPI000EA16ACC|nr:VTT domain-containing protein [Arthrobacter celericrescens]
MDEILKLPFGAALAILFGIVMVRVNVTYWLGRGAAAGVERSRFAARFHTSKAAKAQGLIRRWGPFAVVLSFLTVGVQTAINFAAGAAVMPLRRYLPAAVVGSAAWALLYATIGFAAIDAWLALAAFSPLTGLLLLALASGVVLVVIVRRRRRAALAPDAPAAGDTVV